MADANVVRIGDVNQGGTDPLQLFLKKFSGEVLAKFMGSTVMDGKHNTRTITSGKSASFPVVGGIDAEYHTPGAELLGLGVNHNERIIPIDGLLLSHAFLANLDEAMNHYDVRSIYSNQMGNKLALTYDKNVLREVVLGARASALVTDGNGGSVIENADLESATDTTKVQAIVDAIYAAAQAMDEKDAPEGPRFCALKPAEYYMLVNTVQSNGFSAINRDYGGEGSFASGNVIQIGGVQILKTNNLPTTDLSGETYHGVNAKTTKGLIWTPEAVGTVKLMDVASEAEYQISRQGYLMVSKMAVGHGWLRPECCVELRTGDPATA